MNIESFRTTEDLSTIDTTELLKRVESFETRFGNVAEFLKHKAEQSGEQKEDLSDDTYEKNSLKKDLFSDLETVLESTGLDIVSEKEYSRELGATNQDDDIEYDGIAIILKNGKQFVKYLKSLNPEEITDSQMESLKKVLYGLIHAIDYRYNLENPKDDFFELIGNASEILNECKRLGIKDVHSTDLVSFLEEMIRCSKDKCLKEFVLAKNLREFSFELHAHEYLPPSSFKQNWDNIINTLILINENPRAIRVYQNAVSNAKKAIDEAIIFFNDNPRGSGDDLKEEYKIDEKTQKKMIAIAQSIKLRLSEL